MSASGWGPVSSWLEARVKTAVQRHGIVLWLDQEGIYEGFVARLREARSRGEVSYEVGAYRGSHLALMLELGRVSGGVQRGQVLLYVPRHSAQEVAETPLLELWRAGWLFEPGGLEVAASQAAAGRVLPEQLEAWRARPSGSLEEADAWLSGLLRGVGGGLEAQLRALPLEAILDDLLSGGLIARVGLVSEEEALWSHLARAAGLSRAWRGLMRSSEARAQDVAFALGGWALCVEYVRDLRRAPTSELLGGAAGLPDEVAEGSQRLARHLRARHPGFYKRTADEVEALLGDEVTSARAEDLGEIDTFRFEEEAVLKAALGALEERKWGAAARWCDRRLGDEGSFWLGDDPNRRAAWQLVQDAARLGEGVEAAGARMGECESLDDALRAYQARGAAVDRAHRHLEQRRLSLLYPQLPEFERLRTRLDEVREVWRGWADGWARELGGLCRARGFLPSAPYQQRGIFEEVVRPLTSDSKEIGAYFVVDALRYEMAEELSQSIEGTPGATVSLKARLAELPSVTAVGMNALAPVASQGRLRPVVSSSEQVVGFVTGSYQVVDPATRKRAMHDRVGGQTCPWYTLEEVVGQEGKSLKHGIKNARLVVVHSQEIDQAGERGAGPAVFDAIMQRLRAAWHLLREAGVRRFVFTSDHGFLLLDDLAPVVQAHGRKVDPRRRYVYSPVGADHPGEVRASLGELGYEGASGHVMFPEGVGLFDTGRRFGGFVHGGNSLQERAVPVLVVTHRIPAGSSGAQYRFKTQEREPVGGMHRVAVLVEYSALQLMGATEVEVGARVMEVSGVQVELCQTHGKARLERGTVVATVGEWFELYFRLTGATEARVLLELYHPSAQLEVEPCEVPTRFEVTRGHAPTQAEEFVPPSRAWLDNLGADLGVRQLFEHLENHGTVTEAEAANMLGGARGLRRFSLMYDEVIKKVPFSVRVDVLGGVKRYVKEGRA